MKILVTGVGGNVGQYIGNDLAHAGHDVLGIYRNSMPQNADYELIQGNISEICGGRPSENLAHSDVITV